MVFRRRNAFMSSRVSRNHSPRMRFSAKRSRQNRSMPAGLSVSILWTSTTSLGRASPTSEARRPGCVL